jgi:hypothetical protein
MKVKCCCHSAGTLLAKNVSEPSPQVGTFSDAMKHCFAAGADVFTHLAYGSFGIFIWM